MLPQSLFLSLFFTLISSPSCFSSFQDDNLANFLDGTPGPSAYPPFFGTIDKDRAVDFEASFANLQMEYEAEIVDSTRYDHLGTPATSLGEVNVDDFGAKGDGVTDDTEAFKTAWEETCSSNTAVLVVPQNKKYHVKPITFSGPCKSDSVKLKILGTIKASEDPSDYAKDRSRWLLFYNIKNFQVEGQGTIDGNGKIWWKNSCKINITQPCTMAPTAVSFVQCDNLKVYGLNVQDAQQMHVRFEESMNVQASNIMVTSSEESPNTDGIHVTQSENVQIIKTVIKTGDDCISIVNGSTNIEAIDVTCGPGHGISIGSLGKGKSEARVSNVMVNTAKLIGTTNGVRIKTWQGGSGYAENIVFQDIKMENVSNPIIIDQNYCDQETPCNEQNSAVQIRNIVYNNITGTSATKMTTIFNCSKTLPCQGIVQKDINLVYKEN
ncbi:polygalacturonase-like [Vitis riparia]|uniref:polygalacturonase-like n=1 Tax=Vitis riparia TaxID=96939 RepID=UPI00155A1EC5|nr:polygalacturonase-like [Vitis riparia]